MGRVNSSPYIFIMEDFSYLNYYTEYSCNGYLNQGLDGGACFSYIFRNLENEKVSIDYNIIIYKGTEFSKEEHNSNACLLTINQLKNHLKQAQCIYPFKFYIKECEHNGFDVFEVNLKLVDIPGMFHKYLLTWTRYTYEFPYNVLLIDAYKLKNEKCFKFSSIANIFNIVLGSIDWEDSNNIHQIPQIFTINKSLKINDLREKLNKIERLNELYEALKNTDRFIPNSIKELSIEDVEYWNNIEYFEKYRKPVYLNNYKESK